MSGVVLVRLVGALIGKDATTWMMRRAVILSLCWVAVVYAVALMPISMDDSGTNPLNGDSTASLASQAVMMVAATLAAIEIGSGDAPTTILIAGSRHRMAVALTASKTVLIVGSGLLLTAADILGHAVVYGTGSDLRLACRYLALSVMNGVAALSLSLLAGNVLIGLAVYLLTPILLMPFVVSLIPMARGLLYPAAIRMLTVDGGRGLMDTLVPLGWLLVFLIMAYAGLSWGGKHTAFFGNCHFDK